MPNFKRSLTLQRIQGLIGGILLVGLQGQCSLAQRPGGGTSFYNPFQQQQSPSGLGGNNNYNPYGSNLWNPGGGLGSPFGQFGQQRNPLFGGWPNNNLNRQNPYYGSGPQQQQQQLVPGQSGSNPQGSPSVTPQGNQYQRPGGFYPNQPYGVPGGGVNGQGPQQQQRPGEAQVPPNPPYGQQRPGGDNNQVPPSNPQQSGNYDGRPTGVTQDQGQPYSPAGSTTGYNEGQSKPPAPAYNNNDYGNTYDNKNREGQGGQVQPSGSYESPQPQQGQRPGGQVSAPYESSQGQRPGAQTPGSYDNPQGQRPGGQVPDSYERPQGQRPGSGSDYQNPGDVVEPNHDKPNYGHKINPRGQGQPEPSGSYNNNDYYKEPQGTGATQGQGQYAPANGGEPGHKVDDSLSQHTPSWSYLDAEEE